LLASPEILRMHEDQDRFLLVEQFIPGKEFAMEGVVTAGELTVLAIFDKPDPLDGPFFEETVYVTPSREPAEVQRAMVDCTRRAVVALGLLNGPIHAEMRVNASGVWMLEIAGRPIGGLCAACLKYAGGQSLEDVLLRHAVGELPANLKLADPARGVMMIPIPRAGVYSGVSGPEGARSLPGIEDVIITAKEGQKLVPLPEGASYLGFIFSRGENVDAAEAALRAAHAELSFSIAGELPVLSAG
jgi:biotin carboxylase